MVGVQGPVFPYRWEETAACSSGGKVGGGWLSFPGQLETHPLETHFVLLPIQSPSPEEQVLWLHGKQRPA